MASPSTPPPRNLEGSPSRALQGLEALKATPSSRGSAAMAHHFTNFSVDAVKPSILADIEKHDTCTIDQLLTAFLVRCLPAEQQENPPKDLLERCIVAVLPISNETQPKKGLGLRHYLAEYCAPCSVEQDRYAPFVLTFNHALKETKKITGLPLRPPSDLDVMFQRQDPIPITATHDGMQSKRKPDITIVALAAMVAAYNVGAWDDLAMKDAPYPPKGHLPWDGQLLSMDLKLKLYALGNVPEAYEKKACKHYPPQTFKHLLKELGEPEKEGEASKAGKRAASSSKKTRDSGAQPVRCSGRKSTMNSSQKASQKRSALDSGRTTSSKKQKVPKKPPAMLQCALYGAERLSHACWIWSAINLVVIDDVAYIWYYDNERAIQSAGINFVKDLPYFLVLLLALQRFTLEDWGVNIELMHATVGDKPILFPNPNVSVKLYPDQRLQEHFGFLGRASQVLVASSESADPRNRALSLKGKELVAKVYHPEITRGNEAETIKHAKKKGKGDPEIEGHLPDVICSLDFPAFSTDKIRKALGIYDDEKAKCTRIPRMIIFVRYYPITNLSGVLFWNIFWQCFRCHYRLWLHGIEHGDISVANLMYDKEGMVGKLNDFDLAHVVGKERPSGWERTGTMPFMALDLLTDEAWEGDVQRRYRHDCESFGWVLLWICGRYHEGHEISNPPFTEWGLAASYRACHLAKLGQEYGVLVVTATSSYSNFWPAAVKLALNSKNRRITFTDSVALQALDPFHPLPPEPSQEKFIEEWIAILKDPTTGKGPLTGLKLVL